MEAGVFRRETVRFVDRLYGYPISKNTAITADGHLHSNGGYGVTNNDELILEVTL